jgi:Tol biopolymer transport system component
MYAGGTVMNPTPDGRFLVVAVEGKEMATDLWLVPLSGGTKPVPLLQQDFDQIDGRVSQDGRWLAYVSNESGTNEVFVRPLKNDSTTGVPVAGSRLLISSGGGTAPRWRKDGRELFYQSRGGAVMAVVFDGASVGKPTELFRAAGIQTDWSVSADGQRFLVAAPSRESAPAFRVVVNWQSPLKH